MRGGGRRGRNQTVMFLCVDSVYCMLAVCCGGAAIVPRDSAVLLIVICKCMTTL